MKRVVQHHDISDRKAIKNALLEWSKKERQVLWLDGNDHVDPYGNFDALLAVGTVSQRSLTCVNGAFNKLKEYQEAVGDWIFGYLSYDLKNDVERLSSANKDRLVWPALHFFQPKKILILRGTSIELHYVPQVAGAISDDATSLLKLAATTILKQSDDPKISQNKLIINARLSKSAYLAKAKAMIDHIYRGDIYEANLCMEFYAEGCIEPLETFKHLNAISQAPFAAYFKSREKHVLCASPERFMCKHGQKITSQPIKGTAKRSDDVLEDRKFAYALSQNIKERSENIMITDLVRNDLSRIAQKGSVVVEGLCRVYPFKQVHQMISTISATVDRDISPVKIIRETFPMGSMTGAPKIRAMQLIEKLETHKRGIYSGALGYITPRGDFDFNVVIRSILYDAIKKMASFSVGSALTAAARPEMEYEECLLKAAAMREVLTDGKA